MPTIELTRQEYARAEQLQAIWRNRHVEGEGTFSSPTAYREYVRIMWERVTLYIPAGVFMRPCSSCHTPYPDDPRWFYVRPPENTYTRCQVCYRRYQARYNADVRRKARELKLPTPRAFGLELEFIGSARAVEQAMRANGLECYRPGYTHEVMSTWKIVPDGSVARGGELVSPILSGEPGTEATLLACQALREAGTSTDRSTGLHVHHTVRDLDTNEFKKVLGFWYNTQDVLEQLVSPSRRTSHWCAKLTPNDLARVEGCMDLHYTRTSLYLDRYRNLNVSAYLNYGTMEVRWHQGTRDARKIIGWTGLFQAIISYVQLGGELPRHGEELESVLERLQHHDVLEPRMTEWLKNRAKQLNPKTETEMQARAAALVRERQQREEAYRNGYTLSTTEESTTDEYTPDTDFTNEPEWVSTNNTRLCAPGTCGVCDERRGLQEEED